jgi:hypothetical protein
LVQTLKDEVE